MFPELSCSCCNARVHARFHNNTWIEWRCNSDIEGCWDAIVPIGDKDVCWMGPWAVLTPATTNFKMWWQASSTESIEEHITYSIMPQSDITTSHGMRCTIILLCGTGAEEWIALYLFNGVWESIVSLGSDCYLSVNWLIRYHNLQTQLLYREMTCGVYVACTLCKRMRYSSNPPYTHILACSNLYQKYPLQCSLQRSGEYQHHSAAWHPR